MVWLTRLILHDNAITELPKALSLLVNLERLGLNGNRLDGDALTPLKRLPSLRRLYLADNRIDRLPHQLSRLTALRCLGLHGNTLALIPRWVGRLRRLEKLFLGADSLEEGNQVRPFFFFFFFFFFL